MYVGTLRIQISILTKYQEIKVRQDGITSYLSTKPENLLSPSTQWTSSTNYNKLRMKGIKDAEQTIHQAINQGAKFC